jgi:phage replication initiation protein
LDALEKAKIMFGPGLEWVEVEKGRWFYARSLRRGHVSIFYDGNAGAVTVEVTGQGCRQLEAERVLDVPCEENGFRGGWRGFLSDLRDLGCTFPRVDWALDDTEGRLNLETIEATWKAGNCASRFQNMEPRTKYNREGDLVGHTLNFGSRKSQMFVRIYNKHLERLAKGEEVPHAHWTRTEIEAHDRGADALVKKFVEEGPGVVASVLRHYLDFKQETGDSNLSRRPSCSWWLAFLDWAEKVPVGIGAAARSLEGMAKALWQQWSGGIALLLAAPSHGPQWFAELFKHGETRWKSKHITMLAAALAPVQPFSEGGDGSDTSPMMRPELVPPLGQVQNRCGSDEFREDVQYFSPLLGRWYKPGRSLQHGTS